MTKISAMIVFKKLLCCHAEKSFRSLDVQLLVKLAAFIYWHTTRVYELNQTKWKKKNIQQQESVNMLLG